MGLRIDRKQDKRVVHACTHNLADIPNGVTVCSAELVAGGVLQEGTVIGKDEAGLFHAVKTARVTEEATNAATSYKVAKGHHFKKGDFVMVKVGGKAYAVTGIDSSEATHDTITVGTTLGEAVKVGDALVEAFEGGEDAAKAFGDVANDVLKNAVKNALKLQFLEKPLQNAIKQLQKDMGFDEEGNGTFDGLTEAEQARFKNAIKEAGANFAAAMDMYKDLFTDLDNTDPSTLSGAISSASQESIDLLAGQTNAVRQNQVTSIQLIREQLMHLANMDRGIGVIADRVQSIINHLTTAASDDNGLRSQGITD